jgi:hypothetical protein
MADHSSHIQFEDVPLEEARRMGRGPRMDPELYHAIREKIQSLDSTATRIALPEGTSPTTMKNRIVRMNWLRVLQTGLTSCSMWRNLIFQCGSTSFT